MYLRDTLSRFGRLVAYSAVRQETANVRVAGDSIGMAGESRYPSQPVNFLVSMSYLKSEERNNPTDCLRQFCKNGL
jgi:hypothetical protein